MPRHHSPDQKAAAIQQLNANGGDIATTAVQTGIPIRTLYTWRKELWIQQVKQQQTSGVQTAAAARVELPHFDNDVDAFLYLRDQAVKFANAISIAIQERMHTHFNTPWMWDRIHAQNGLITIILKLDAYLKPHLERRKELAELPDVIYAWSDEDNQFDDEYVEEGVVYKNGRAFN